MREVNEWTELGDVAARMPRARRRFFRDTFEAIYKSLPKVTKNGTARQTMLSTEIGIFRAMVHEEHLADFDRALAKWSRK